MKLFRNMAAVALASTLMTTGAIAADVYTGERTYSEPTQQAVYDDWNGGYVGGLIGWDHVDADGLSRLHHDKITDFLGEPLFIGKQYDDSDNSLSGGVYVGADQQFGTGGVIGVILDHRFTDLSVGDITVLGDADRNLAHETNVDISGLGSARLRIGALVSPKDLVYATGGVAWGLIDTNSSVTHNDGPTTDVLGSDSDDEFKIGWTAGLGYETKRIADNVRMKIEYLYTDLGEVETDIGFEEPGLHLDSKADLTVHTVQVGVAYEF